MNMRVSGKAIRAARERMGFTVRDLARFVGRTHQSITGYELEDTSPSASTLANIAVALDVPMTSLLIADSAATGAPGEATSPAPVAEDA